MTDHVAQGGAPVFWSRFLVASAHGGQAFGDAVSGGDQEMPTATGGIADFEIENGLLWVRLCTGFRQDRFQGRIEQTVDQAGGSIVAARGLALVTASNFQ